MKKYLVILLAVLALALLVSACNTVEGSLVEEGQNWELIDHEYAQFDREPPDWLFMETSDLEDERDYEDYYVFKFETERAEELRGAQLLRDDFEAARGIARLVSMRVQNHAAAAVVGDENSTEAYIEDVVNILAEADVVGWEREADYWTLRRFYDERHRSIGEFYSVFSLYIIPRANLDALLQSALEQATSDHSDDSPEEISAQDRVRDAFENGM